MSRQFASLKSDLFLYTLPSFPFDSPNSAYGKEIPPSVAERTIMLSSFQLQGLRAQDVPPSEGQFGLTCDRL
jgi:hypothetical protein